MEAISDRAISSRAAVKSDQYTAYHPKHADPVIKQIVQGREMMLRATMTAHKFTVGEAVSFSPDKSQEHTRGELFEIVRLLPETGDAPQYRIKSQTNDHERVVREDQLAPA